jgi:SynChlorMet cassette radical SAM/SPASM protein ScmE
LNDYHKSSVLSSPRQIDIAITGRCNLACRYCFFADEMVARSDLPTGRWLSFFDELGEMGVMTVSLTGGEVFTRPDLFELIDGLIANRMRYELLSNGTLITEKVLEQFEIGKRRQRLNSIQISVDGASAEVHDRSRPKSFSRVLRALKLLKEAGYPVSVRVTINRHNVDDLENVARLLLEEVGLESFSTNEAYACGATDRSEGSIILTPTQRQQAMEVLTRLSKSYDRRIQAQAGPLAMAREMQIIDEMRAGGKTGRPGRGVLASCGCAFSKLSVLHDGVIVPCHVLSTYHLGIVGFNRLREIWSVHPTLSALRHRHEIPLSTLPTCQDCDYIGFCLGGCPGGAVHAYGEMNARNPMDCYRVLKNEDPFYTLSETPIFSTTDDRNE